MKLIIGLGNPGLKFQGTKHNAGALLLKKWMADQDVSGLKISKKLRSLISESANLIIGLPQVFMNESGQAVKKISGFFRIEPKNILIVHDDSDLNVGEYKLQFNRGSAGHNGINSIINHLGTKNFWRLRIGIRVNNPAKRLKAEEFVLKKFSHSELEIIEKSIPEISKLINEWIKG